MMHLKEAKSTNSYVLEHADELGEWEVVLADREHKNTGGQAIPEGVLHMSVLINGETRPYISQVAAVAVADVLIYMGLSPCLKWPSDVIVKGKRIARISVDRRNELSAVGIELNCNFHAEELGELADGITTVLDETGMEKNIELVAEAIANSLQAMIERSDALALWRFLSCTLGRRVRIESTESFEGIAEDIDESGALLVRTDDGVKRVISGDCIHL